MSSSPASLSEKISAGLAYSMSSICMLLINKLAVRSYHQTFSLLTMQNLATLLILSFWNRFVNPPALQVSADGKSMEEPSFQMKKAKAFLPAVLLFVLMLFSSLESLAYVSIATVIVFRNLNSLLVALGDMFLLKQSISTKTWVALFIIILGSILYAYDDLDYDTTGYFWTFLNIGAAWGYSLYVKWLLQDTDYTSMELVMYNNTISTPIFFLVAVILQEPLSDLFDLYTYDFYGLVWVILSLPLAFAISSAGFWAQKVFSATTWITMNNLNKIPVIIAGVYIFDNFLSWGSFFGLCISLVGGALYSQASFEEKKRKAGGK